MRKSELADQIACGFIHGYGHEVKWEVVEEPLRLLPDTIAAVADAWERWLATLR